MSNDQLDSKDYLGHRKRLRERFTKVGLNSLQDYEIIELLLTFSIPYRDVKPIAKQLLKEFGSIRNIFDADSEELKKVPYVKEKTTDLIAFIKEISALYRKEVAENVPVSKSIKEIATYFIEKIGYKKEEEFLVIYLDSKLSIMQEEKHFPAKIFYTKGTVDKTAIYPREIMLSAIKNKAYALVIAHNHPNGNIQPSDYDKTLTSAIGLASKTLGLILYDHIIVSSKNYFSFRENGIL